MLWFFAFEGLLQTSLEWNKCCQKPPAVLDVSSGLGLLGFALPARRRITTAGLFVKRGVQITQKKTSKTNGQVIIPLSLSFSCLGWQLNTINHIRPTGKGLSSQKNTHCPGRKAQRKQKRRGVDHTKSSENGSKMKRNHRLLTLTPWCSSSSSSTSCEFLFKGPNPCSAKSE